MSTADPTRPRSTVRQFSAGENGDYVVDRFSPWVGFAAVMFALLATLNFIDGVAAVSNSTFFVGDAKYVFSDLNTWGWVLIAISVVQLATAIGVWARWPGVLGRRGDRRPQCDRTDDDDARLSVLVDVPVRCRHRRHLRPRGARRQARLLAPAVSDPEPSEQPRREPVLAHQRRGAARARQ
jgi:hypothetical protein